MLDLSSDYEHLIGWYKKNERRKFIYYEVYWDANDWLGIPITKWRPDGHIEGNTELLMRPKLDPITGEHIDNIFAGTRESYYIPFTKKNVDEIIANSAHTDKFGIKYNVKFGLEDSPDGITMSTRNQFSYDMFLWDWDRLHEFQYWPIDDFSMRPKANANNKTATKLEFKPS